MKKNYMAEKCFREIEREILQNPKERKEYLEKKAKREYINQVSRKVRKELHMYV